MIASHFETVDAKLSPNSQIITNINDNSDDKVTISGLSSNEEFNITFGKYYDATSKSHTFINGKADSEVKAINSDEWVEIIGTVELDVVTELDNDNVDHININTNGHSVKILRNEHLDLDYLIDNDDDGIYSICETKGHDWDEWVVTKEATETEEGLETRTCKNDSNHTETRVIPKLTHSHTFVKTAAKKATCTETGNIEYWTCSKCGKHYSDEAGANEIMIEDTLTAALGHDYGEWYVTTPADCDTDGEEKRVCAHDNRHIETRRIAATGHDWDEGVVTIEPTSTEEGIKTYTCKNNPSHIKTEIIPATGEDSHDDNSSLNDSSSQLDDSSDDGSSSSNNSSETDDSSDINDSSNTSSLLVDSSSMDNSSSSNTSSNYDSGSTSSYNNASTNNVVQNPGSTNNPNTGNVDTTTQAVGLSVIMLGILTVLKKKKQ